ncbi:MAG: cupredoxin domain-containing protein [Nitrospirae bacterium]|nr:cupredoxin domain-containing protein [Nitrospirota bacterium]
MMRSTSQCLVVALTVLLFLALGVASTLADANRQEVRIAIKARAFQPAEVTVQAGHEVVLRFDNHDVEIHAFVPEQFLERVLVQVDGSGAPFFGDKGLTRLLIPGGGQATLRFVPRIPGRYRYRCDLPGHQMVGHIRVE